MLAPARAFAIDFRVDQAVERTLRMHFRNWKVATLPLLLLCVGAGSTSGHGKEEVAREA